MINLTIVSIQEKIFCDDVDFFVVDAEGGQIGVYPHHIDMLSLLQPGLVRVYGNGDKQSMNSFFIAGGILEIFQNHAVILADSIERSADLDTEKVLLEKKLVLSKKHKHNHNGNSDTIFYDEIQILLAKIRAVRYMSQQ